MTSVYSPGRRTAVVLAGTGAHGAYHAGALRALEEADVEKGMISTSSPIGRAILNKEEGDEIKVVTPNGSKTFELIKLITIHDEA